jgi:hypothetical protein
MNLYGWIPEGSTLQVTEDNGLSIIPPSGWIYVGTLENSGEIYTVTDGGVKVSCTCNTTGDCLPFAGTKGKNGCYGNCTNCTMKKSVSATGDGYQSVGYFNIDVDPAIILQSEEFPASFKDMANIPEVNAKIQQFYEEYFPSEPVPDLEQQGEYLVAPTGYLIAMVNICGRAMPLIIPETAMIAGGAGGAAAKCSCIAGSCTIDSTMGVKYCVGTCTGSCTLQTSVNVGGDVTYISETYNF